jgi:hypothetical protein
MINFFNKLKSIVITPKSVDMTKEQVLDADFKIDGMSIMWLNKEQFKTIDENSVLDVYGFAFNKFPKVEQTLSAEFTQTFKKFKFIEVERCSDPDDMFFAKVVPIGQYIK